MVKSCIYAINNMIFFKMSLFPLNTLNKPDRTESIIPFIRRITYSSSLRTNERRHMGFKEQYFDIWQQVWSLHKKYYAIQEQDEKRWKQLIDESEAICQKYEHMPEGKFVESLLLAVIGELSRESKKTSNRNRSESTIWIGGSSGA